MELERVDRDYADRILDEDLTLQNLFARDHAQSNRSDENPEESKSGMSSMNEFEGDDSARRSKIAD